MTLGPSARKARPYWARRRRSMCQQSGAPFSGLCPPVRSSLAEAAVGVIIRVNPVPMLKTVHLTGPQERSTVE